MGGKSKRDNSMMAFQMQQAAEARQREAERKERLDTGTARIDEIFNNAHFDQNYYDRYSNALLTNTLGQLGDQYKTAKTKAGYDLARAGLTRSSAAAEVAGKLGFDNTMRETELRAQADNAVGAMRENVLGQKQQAISQLYATEDPNVAANTATTMVNQQQLATPNLTPLGALFTPIAIGGIGALTSAQNANQFGSGLNANTGRGGGAIRDYG